MIILWFVSALILLSSKSLKKILGERGLVAIECLMGMLLTAVAVEKVYIKDYHLISELNDSFDHGILN